MKKIESANFKDKLIEIIQSEEHTEKRNEEKCTEANRPVGQHQANEHMHNESPRGRGQRERGRRIFKEILAKI